MKAKARSPLLKTKIEEERSKIVDLYFSKVHGRKFEDKGGTHDGRRGHALEAMMGLTRNCRNQPDFVYFELKIDTKSKTSYGDWSPSYWIFNDPSGGISRAKFMEIFGKYNEKKSRWSWSGKPVPKINVHNTFGQILEVDPDLSISIRYSYSKDQREDKATIVPAHLCKDDLMLAKWDAQHLRCLVENKFNHGGWCKCKKDKNGVFNEIVFGDPFTYEQWVGWVKTGDVFFDSGMCQKSSRNYASWRAHNEHWDAFIKERHGKGTNGKIVVETKMLWGGFGKIFTLARKWRGMLPIFRGARGMVMERGMRTERRVRWEKQGFFKEWDRLMEESRVTIHT